MAARPDLDTGRRGHESLAMGRVSIPSTPIFSVQVAAAPHPEAKTLLLHGRITTSSVRRRRLAGPPTTSNPRPRWPAAPGCFAETSTRRLLTPTRACHLTPLPYSHGHEGGFAPKPRLLYQPAYHVDLSSARLLKVPSSRDLAGQRVDHRAAATCPVWTVGYSSGRDHGRRPRSGALGSALGRLNSATLSTETSSCMRLTNPPTCQPAGSATNPSVIS